MQGILPSNKSWIPLQNSNQTSESLANRNLEFQEQSKEEPNGAIMLVYITHVHAHTKHTALYLGTMKLMSCENCILMGIGFPCIIYSSVFLLRKLFFCHIIASTSIFSQPGMVTTDLLMSGANTKQVKCVINFFFFLIPSCKSC